MSSFILMSRSIISKYLDQGLGLSLGRGLGLGVGVGVGEGLRLG